MAESEGVLGQCAPGGNSLIGVDAAVCDVCACGWVCLFGGGGPYINIDSRARGACEGVGVVEEGPGNETAGVYVAVCRQRSVATSIDILLRRAGAARGGGRDTAHLFVIATPHIPEVDSFHM